MPSPELDPTQAQVQAQSGQTGSALTGSVADVGPGLQATADAVTVQQSAVIDTQVETEDRSMGDAFSAVIDNGATAWIARKLAKELDSTWDRVDIDPNFKAASHVEDVLAQYNLEGTDDTLRELGGTRSLGEMNFLASEAARNKENQRIVSEHGVLAFTGSMVDPTQLLTDFATFGATRAWRLGRVGSGLLGGTATVAPIGLADLSGRETAGMDYILSAALGAGAFSLFGGEAANRIARGEANWYGRSTRTDPAQNGTQGTRLGRINEFTTEHDRLVMPSRVGSDERADLMKKLGDDPVRRGSMMTNDNAPSFLRVYANEMDGLAKNYQDGLDDALKMDGHGWASRRVDFGGRTSSARDDIEMQVSEEILLRDEFFRRYGNERLAPRTDERISVLADKYETAMNRMGEIARDAKVSGFEEFAPRPGYFHRSWNAAAITKNNSKAVRSLIAAAALKGMPGIDDEVAQLIAKSITDRAQSKLRNEGIDFFGTLGKTDTGMLREILEGNKSISKAKVDSIMGRIEQNLDQKSVVKYGKNRLPFDMSVVQSMPDGSVMRMTDFIDTDLSRLMENYVSNMAGRSALSKSGVGSSDSAIETFKRSYADSLKTLPEDVRQDRMEVLDGLLSDFTGNRPAQNTLGQGASRLKSIADSTMLAASGLWQVAEYATMAHRFGFVNSNVEFLRQFPGIAGTFRKMGRDPDLRDEMETVLNLDLARDIRVRQWTRQHDVNLRSSDTGFDRALHAGKQMVPYLNAMKYVHKHQARMNANLAINKLARAAAGDPKAVKMVEQYGLKGADWERVQKAFQSNATYKGKNAKQVNWAAWEKADVDSAMNVALRMMDDATLYGRAGQGLGTPLLARSAIGQVLGQFRSFVSFAHNKLLRGTLENSGTTGVASLLAFQYPLTGMMVMVNETRKGNLDTSEKGLRNIALRTLGYTAGLGMVGDAAGIVGLTGGRGGLSTPITGIFDAAPTAAGGIGKIFGGEVGGGALDISKAASMVVPTLNVIPGIGLAIKSMQE